MMKNEKAVGCGLWAVAGISICTIIRNPRSCRGDACVALFEEGEACLAPTGPQDGLLLFPTHSRQPTAHSQGTQSP